MSAHVYLAAPRMAGDTDKNQMPVVYEGLPTSLEGANSRSRQNSDPQTFAGKTPHLHQWRRYAVGTHVWEAGVMPQLLNSYPYPRGQYREVRTNSKCARSVPPEQHLSDYVDDHLKTNFFLQSDSDPYTHLPRSSLDERLEKRSLNRTDSYKTHFGKFQWLSGPLLTALCTALSKGIQL